MPNSAQTRIDRNTYIPPHIQQAMTQHMQQNMPAHLKKYVGSDAAYVPKHMEAALAKNMQKNMPAHLKKYSGAYMQQQVVQPNTTRLRGPAAITSRETFAPGPMPDKNRLGHSMPVGEQHTVDPNAMPNRDTLFAAENQQSPAQPNQSSPDQAYDFIFDPDQPPKRRAFLPSNSTTPVKFAIIGGGLVMALLVLSVAKSLFFSGNSNYDSFIVVAQDQQALIHLADTADQEQDISVANKNFSATASLSLGSAKSDLITYLAKNGKKVKVDLLSLKISKSTDAKLEAASAAATYNETYKDVMKTKLNEYKRDLKQAYDQTEGPIGQKLLSQQYDQAGLLLIQLEDTRS